ncbi:MAG: BON domain-containing protein [Magnetospirillum sp.]|nr:BON domain-containing protein [Magnetospirillum sp.]
MNPDMEMVERVRSELGKEPRIGEGAHPIALDYKDGVLVMDGELEAVAAKKLALERAAAIPGIVGIVDRLRVAPAERMGDGELARRLGDALAGEGAFARYRVEGAEAGKPRRVLQAPDDAAGAVTFEVSEGVVILNGEVSGLDHKRLAGVLAWWMPGTRDVVNGIAVEPPEDDTEGSLVDGVRIVLEKDPLVPAAQIRVGASGSVVFLSGLVASAAQRDMAEKDAWCVFGVDRVVDDIRVGR